MEELEKKRALIANRTKEKRQKAEQKRIRRGQKTIAKKQKKAGKSKLADKLAFGKKISKHWYILVAAIIFDIFGVVPFIGVLANLTFGLLLFLYFGPKRKKAGASDFTGIVLPIALGSAFDFFIGILPVNIGAALIRIAMD